MRSLKNITSALLALFAAGTAAFAQQAVDGNEWSDPSVGNRGAARLRSEFISYDVRELAEQGAVDKNPYYVPLDLQAAGDNTLAAEVDIPYLWLDRDIFIQVEGIPSYYLSVGGRTVGYGEDNRTPLQFDISGYVRDGVNMVSISPAEGTGSALDIQGQTIPHAFIFSQPKLRIDDFTMKFEPDTTDNRRGILDIEIILSNSYNSAEEAEIGYDVYSPQKKLENFDIESIVVAGRGRDTVRFAHQIYRTPGNEWSASKPGLYYGMLTVKRGNRIVEYIPYRIGYGTTVCSAGAILRNGEAIDIAAARYNSAVDEKTTSQQIAALKKGGINTVCPDYPQPVWFYDICDGQGMYVIEQPNINSDPQAGNRKVGGALSNDPRWLGSCLSRAQAAYYRTRNHSCIIGWSVGGAAGNGFNMYRTYLWLKDVAGLRAVVFDDAQGEWNSDMQLLEPADPRALLSAPPAATHRR